MWVWVGALGLMGRTKNQACQFSREPPNYPKFSGFCRFYCSNSRRETRQNKRNLKNHEFVLQLWSARSLRYQRIVKIFPPFRARGDEILHFYTWNDCYQVEKGKETNFENFDFGDFFYFGARFSILKNAFSVQILIE